MHWVIRKRGKWWWIDVRDPRLKNGRDRAPLRTQDEAEARALAPGHVAVLEKELTRGPTPTLLDFLLAVAKEKPNEETRDMYERKAARICAVLGAGTDPATLGALEIGQYLAKRAKKVSKHTVGKEATLLRQAYALGMPDMPNPVPEWHVEYEPRTRFLSHDEAELLLAEANDAARRWIMFALFTTSEPAALKRMDWQDVNRRTKVVHVRGTKRSKRDRFVPIHPTLEEFLDTLDPNAPMILPWPARQRCRDLERWCRKAGIEHCTFLDLRRTCISWMKQLGVDNRAAADIAGHATTAMVDKIYGQLNMDTYRAAISKLQPLNFGHKPRHKPDDESGQTDNPE